jgi:hypothetical protein
MVAIIGNNRIGEPEPEDLFTIPGVDTRFGNQFFFAVDPNTGTSVLYLKKDPKKPANRGFNDREIGSGLGPVKVGIYNPELFGGDVRIPGTTSGVIGPRGLASPFVFNQNVTRDPNETLPGTTTPFIGGQQQQKLRQASSNIFGNPNIIGGTDDGSDRRIKFGDLFNSAADFRGFNDAISGLTGETIFLKEQAIKAAQRQCEAQSPNNTPEGCRRSSEILVEVGGTDGALPFEVQRLLNVTPEGEPTGRIEFGSGAPDNANSVLNSLSFPARAGTRTSFGDLKYPLDLNPQQDVIKFALLQYKTKAIQGFSFANRPRVGPSGGGGRIKGTVILPIQSGIKDQNSVDWGEDKMNPLQVGLSAAALQGLGAKGQENALSDLVDAVGQNGEEVKKGLKAIFAGQAAGVQGLLKRTAGAIVNPNLELLFNSPTLRPFTFSFKMSARSKEEAEAVVKIIRFFKQGMAPIRTRSNLFLLAPHTFQVYYLRRGENVDNPYIGKMKECAMTSLSTDYTPENNYATLPDGEMVSYTITMELKELEPIFNDDYENGSANNASNNLPAEIGF